ncbi:MAG: hypothetical protein ACRETB_02970 [Steroidobacteraceae bacterium]
MKVRIVISLLCATLAASAALVTGTALAETVVVNGKVAVEASSIPRPQRGMNMAHVERQFGAPVTRHAAVGNPPITRWDYPDYSVFFERHTVIHTVVTGRDQK